MGSVPFSAVLFSWVTTAAAQEEWEASALGGAELGEAIVSGEENSVSEVKVEGEACGEAEGVMGAMGAVEVREEVQARGACALVASAVSTPYTSDAEAAAAEAAAEAATEATAEAAMETTAAAARPPAQCAPAAHAMAGGGGSSANLERVSLKALTQLAYKITFASIEPDAPLAEEALDSMELYELEHALRQASGIRQLRILELLEECTTMRQLSTVLQARVAAQGAGG